MKYLLVVLLIFSIACKAQEIRVAARFSAVSNSVYVTDDLDFEDELFFYHEFDGDKGHPAVKKLFSTAVVAPNGSIASNNTFGLWDTEYYFYRDNSAFGRYYAFWEDDRNEGTFDNPVCDPFCSEGDDRFLQATEGIDMAGYPSGVWNTRSNGWTWITVYYQIKFDMPIPATPSNAGSGINYICGNTQVTASTYHNLPNGFDGNQVEYEWSYTNDYKIDSVLYTKPYYPYDSYYDYWDASIYSVTNTTNSSTYTRNIPDVATRKKVGYRVRSRYRGGEWSTYSATGTFDLYPGAPQIEPSDILNPTHVKCTGDLTGKIHIDGIQTGLPANYHKFTVAYIATVRGLPFKRSTTVNGLSFNIPNLAAGTYKLIVKNGHGLADSAAFQHGECHTVIENLPTLTITEPATLPFISYAQATPKNGSQYHVSCTAGTPNDPAIRHL